MTKFTSAPWTISGLINKDIVGGDGEVVCRVAVPFNDTDQRDANAHLIAAAPDMYEALEAAREQIEFKLKVAGDYGQFHDLVPVIDAAIKKARGE